MAGAARGVFHGLAGRAFLVMVATLATVLGVAYVLLARSSHRTGDDALRKGLEQSADLVAQFLAGRQRSLTGGARVFVQGPYFRAIVGERRRDDILDQTFEAAAQLDADWVFVVDDRGILLAKSDEPGASGGDLSEVALVRGALRGQITSGFGVTGDSLLFQAVAVPIAIPGGAPVGVLVATKLVDSVLARDVKAVSASEIVFYALTASGSARRAAATLPMALAERLMAATGASGGAAPPGVPERLDLDGVAFALQGGGLTTAGGEPVGGFVVLREAEGANAGIGAVRRGILLAALAGLALALVVAATAARTVARPLRTLALVVRDSLDVRTEATPTIEQAAAALPLERRDEIGALALEIGEQVAELRDRALLATAVSPAPQEASPIDDAGGNDAPALTISRHGSAAAARRSRPSPSRATVGALQPGDVVAGRFEIRALLGSGRTATVYRASDRQRGFECALKMIAVDAAAGDIRSGADLLERTVAVRALSHRNVVRLHDVGWLNERVLLATELVEGWSLEAALRSAGPMPPATVLSIARQLFRALVAAHDTGVVHGMLSPRQLLLRRDGVLKLADCGMVALVRDAGRDEDAGRPRPPSITGAAVGQPQYMAPELLLGAPADVAADMYAAGVLLSECLTGPTPLMASPLAVLIDALGDERGTAPAMRRSALQGLVAELMTADRAQRPSEPDGVLRRLERMA